ncbi:MAG TPA: OmpH family outer membrane protein [Deinococcales bacterium]|nr:OmpH family outer membrane protein [Deinococcales bacterium]
MKRISLIILAAVAVAAVGSLNLQAQSPGMRIAFVNSQEAIDSHPAGQAAREVEERGVSEISEIQENLNAIMERARSGEPVSPEEQEAFQTGQIALESTADRYAEEVAEAAEPAVQAVDTALKAVAAEQGYTIVFDLQVAQQSGLIVYAEDGLDITDLVIEQIQ